MYTITSSQPFIPSVTSIMLPNTSSLTLSAIEAAGEDPSGWATPYWSPESMRSTMQKIGVQTAMLSLTAPGVEGVPGSEAQIKLARNVNEYAASLRDANPKPVGFFLQLYPLSW